MGKGARIFDIVGAVLALTLALPLMVVAMLAIWLGDRRSPIYRAPRVGLHGVDFTMFKLRTMVPEADRLGGRLAPEGDPRVTRVGVWLRRRKIDELPQLLNVLRGEMRLVGPRPDVREGVDAYSSEERRLLAVRPGMTDFASLLFFREARLLANVADPADYYASAIRPEKARLGLLYLERRSLRADLRIIALTVLSFVAREQALARLAKVLRDIDAEDQPASRSPSLTETAGWSGQMPRVS